MCLHRTHKCHYQFLYHAHPTYQGHNQLHEWAFIVWTGDSCEPFNKYVFIPGENLVFLEITEEIFDVDVGGEMIIPSHDSFALMKIYI